MNEWIKQHEPQDMMMGKVHGRPPCVPPTMTDRNWKDTKQVSLSFFNPPSLPLFLPCLPYLLPCRPASLS